MKFQFFEFAVHRLSFWPVSSIEPIQTHKLSKFWRGAQPQIFYFWGEKSLLKSKIDPKHRFYMILPVLSKISLPSTQMDLWTRSCAESPIYCILNRSGGGAYAWNSSHGDLWSLKVEEVMIYTKGLKWSKSRPTDPRILVLWFIGNLQWNSITNHNRWTPGHSWRVLSIESSPVMVPACTPMRFHYKFPKAPKDQNPWIRGTRFLHIVYWLSHYKIRIDGLRVSGQSICRAELT